MIPQGHSPLVGKIFGGGVASCTKVLWPGHTHFPYIKKHLNTPAWLSPIHQMYHRDIFMPTPQMQNPFLFLKIQFSFNLDTPRPRQLNSIIFQFLQSYFWTKFKFPPFFTYSSKNIYFRPNYTLKSWIKPLFKHFQAVFTLKSWIKPFLKHFQAVFTPILPFFSILVIFLQ